jgi:hypothetical protein
MSAKHKFTTELDKNSNEFVQFEEWVTEKLGANRATALMTTGDPLSVEFSSFYDVWMNEFKIVHTIEEDNEVRTISYKDTTAERLAFATNVVNTLAMGGELT